MFVLGFLAIALPSISRCFEADYVISLWYKNTIQNRLEEPFFLGYPFSYMHLLPGLPSQGGLRLLDPPSVLDRAETPSQFSCMWF